MDLVQVDMVGLQALQAVVDRPRHRAFSVRDSRRRGSTSRRPGRRSCSR
jgi:hypothetical protein